jgi:hypothetical protein
MTSYRQIEANRRNALRSTGPKTESGKQVSRGNAVRHGLTAETVISALEDAEDYKAFEAAITADYDAQSAVERELVSRLASLLWLRRATTMETALFEIQAHLRDYRQNCQLLPHPQHVTHAVFGRPDLGNRDDLHAATQDRVNTMAVGRIKSNGPAIEFPRCFLRLANLPNFALDRPSRSKTSSANKIRPGRKPQERNRHRRISIQHESLAYERHEY